MTEFRLFDDPGAEVAEIATDGSTFKPFVNAVSRVDNEARVEVDSDGLQVRIVDPANVFMLDVTLDADAFETYTVAGETELGVNVDELKKLCRRARKGYDDELQLSVRERELTATVGRGYENHDVVSQGTMDLIDPMSIRDSPDIPDLDRNIELEIDTAPFTDALSYAVGAADHVELSVKGVNQHTDALFLGGETDTRKESAAIDGIESEAKGSAIYSFDYVTDILAGIKEVSPETVHVAFDEEFPASFVLDPDETAMRAEFLIAPRITPDD